MKITFYGAAEEVTGSSHMITTTVSPQKQSSILLDCGLFQGHRKEAMEKNCNLLFDPKEVDSMVLSHAHLDHSGRIPLLTKNGFKGDIFCTFATRDLCRVMLEDSAHIQEQDEEYFKKIAREGKAHPLPHCMLYNTEDAQASLEYFRGVNYLKPFYVTENIQAVFHDAGHILGSTLTTLHIIENGKMIKLGFSGDLGRKGLPILRDPEQIDEVDYLIIESTYGDREHDDINNISAHLTEVINTTVERGGKIIIPAFALERTQEIVYHLHKLVEGNKIPRLPIFVDSPLAGNVTAIFQLHPECYDHATYQEFLVNRVNPFGFGELTYTASTEESKALNDRKEPCIIISASGMCEAGRIRHHLANNIEDSRNTILIIGFMAQHTLGRKLVEREPQIKIFDQTYQLNAHVEVINAFSGHAGRSELFNFVKKVKGLKKVFLVHGEHKQSLSLSKYIEKELGIETLIPALGQSVELMEVS